MPFATIAGALAPALIGGAIDASASSKNFGNTLYLNRRANERAIKNYWTQTRENIRQQKEQRVYDEGQLASDRRYAERMAAQERGYYEKYRDSDRDYSEKRLSDDRDYSDVKRLQAELLYKSDRRSMQGLSDWQTEQNARSRGVDFKKLRDDAIAAGFNPLTALSMAGAYSTERNYQVQGGVYDGAPNFFNSGAGYSPGGGGGAPLGATPMSSPSMGAGGAAINGGGYSGGSQQPVLSSGGFIADAVSRAVDTAFNTPSQRDTEADFIRQQVQAGYTRRQLEAETPRNFGWDNTSVVPYRPDVVAGRPALSFGELSPTDDMVTPSSNPIKFGGMDFKPSGYFSDTEAVESRYGDFASWPYGAAAMSADAFLNVANPEKNFWDRVTDDWSSIKSYARTGASPVPPRIPNSSIRW